MVACGMFRQNRIETDSPVRDSLKRIYIFLLVRNSGKGKKEKLGLKKI